MKRSVKLGIQAVVGIVTAFSVYSVDAAIVEGIGNGPVGGVAIGTGADASGGSGTNLGQGIAIGLNTEVHGDLGVAIGSNAKSNSMGNIAIGSDAIADGERSVVIGEGARNNQYGGVAIGLLAQNIGGGEISIGHSASASAEAAMAIGFSSRADSDLATTIGNSSEAKGVASTSLGAYAESKFAAGVAIGAFSHVDRDKGVVGYNVITENSRHNGYVGLKEAALTSTFAPLSIGGNDEFTREFVTRQINYVAAGTSDTDAVNVAQLRNVNLKIMGDTTDSGSDILLDSQALTVAGSNGLETKATGQTITVRIDDSTREKIDNAVSQQTFNTSISQIQGDMSNMKVDIHDLKGQVNGIEQRLEGRTNRMGAQAAAMSGLKAIQFDPHKKSQVMASLGSYRNEQALALGLAHYVNDDLLLHVGTTLGTHHNMVNGGFTYKFGNGSEPKEMNIEATNSNSLVGDMKHRIQTLERENKEQRSEIQILKEQVAILMSKVK